MSEDQIRENLELRPVGLRDLDQYNELLRYVFQVTNQDLEEGGYEDGEIISAKRPVLQRADVIGWFDGDTLISQLSVYPCQVNIHGKIYKMGGLTGVGTYPEYAKMGLMRELIYVALCKMREKGQYISYLYPYSIPYYRKKGWEIMSDHMTFLLKDTQLPKTDDVPGHVKRLEVDDEDVINTYDRFSQTNHGAMIRDKQSWEEYWRWENEEERVAAVYYDEQDKPTGYVFYWIEKDIFHIKDIIYINEEARKGLWNFITAHFSMVDWVKGNTYKYEPQAFLLEDGHITETIEPYYMARIVDVEYFLKEYPFLNKDQPIHFIVSDPLAEWNRGIWSLSWDEEGEIIIDNEPKGPSVELDIQTLTTLLMSYRRPSYLAEIGRLHATKQAVNILEALIPDKQAYFSDYF